MPIYIYKAKTGPSKVITGDIEASSKEAAIKKLNSTGYFPIDIREEKVSQQVIFKSIFSRIKSTHIVTFTRQMSDLIDSGIPIFKALTIVEEQTENIKLKDIIGEIAGKVKAGKSFSESLEDYPDIFSNLYIALVKSGELGGHLDEILLRLADLLEKEDDLKSRVKSAMAYPILMTVVGIITVIVLFTWVMPKLVFMFEELGQTLPLPTRFLLAMSNFFSKNWWILIFLVSGGIFLFRKISSTETGRKNIDNFKLRVPILKELIIKREITRFSRTLGTLLESGVEMISALTAATDVIDNEIIKAEIFNIIARVRDGERLTEGLRDVEQFPVLIPNMIAVGEESGHLDEILLKIAVSFDRKVDYSIKTMTNLLEPIIILVMGLIVGFIVVSILLPIFTIDFASW